MLGRRQARVKIERGESTTSAILRAKPTNTPGLQPEVVSARLLGRVGSGRTDGVSDWSGCWHPSAQTTPHDDH